MLTREEMEIFDEDFKHFLIVNGVHNEEWVRLNEDQGERATQLVELFSDTVLQKVYEKVKFIEHRSKESCMVFQLKKDKIELIALNTKKEGADLSTPESIHRALSETPDLLTAFKTSKAYTKERELEIHQMLEQGCVNSSEAFWRSLEKVLS